MLAQIRTFYPISMRMLIITILWVMAGIPGVMAQDVSDAVVRVGRLENQIRQMSGEIEQLRHENKLLREQLEKLAPGSVVGISGKTDTPAQSESSAAGKPSGGDGSDPIEDSDDGAVKPLGTTIPSRPLSRDEMEPEDTIQKDRTTNILEGDDQEPLKQVYPAPEGGTGQVAGGAAGLTEEDGQSALDSYDMALDYLQSGHFEKAEMQFKKFLHDYPKDSLVPMAIYGLGQSYAKRDRHREAAEQFMLIATNHPKSEPAPDSMVKLGISLNALGAPDKACALFGEIKKRYPEASQTILLAAEREYKRAKCKK